MDKVKVLEAIEELQKSKQINPEYYHETWNDRLERKAYYQSITASKLISMSEDLFTEYISKLWSMMMWGNKTYITRKIIEANGFLNVKEHLSSLLFSSAPLKQRWDTFLSSIKFLGPAAISELLMYVRPDEYMVFNSTTIRCLAYLGVKNLPKYQYQYTGSKFLEICNYGKDIALMLKEAGEKDYDLLAVDYFLWDEVLPLAEKYERTDNETMQDDMPSTPNQSQSFHSEIQEKLVEIGQLLGFESQAEVKIAQGAVVDVIWEAKIGNMGKAIYVFEVQCSGSIDSLILNLKRAQSNAAVQAVVAVSDGKQLGTIINESRGVIEEHTLRTWESDDVLTVHEHMKRAHESINQLDLVPDSFK